MTKEEAQKIVGQWGYWYHIFEIFPGVLTPGISDSLEMLRQMNLPEDLTGKTVLDIGASDGFFSFECLRRGAKYVTALDYRSPNQTGFNITRQVYESQYGSTQNLVHENLNIYDLQDSTGQFDIVLFLGVLYHLKDMCLALDIIRSQCAKNAKLYLESHCCDYLGQPMSSPLPIALFHLGNELNNDKSNYWSPNMACILAMLKDAGFEPTNYLFSAKNRAMVTANSLENWAYKDDTNNARGVLK
jgi:tRNA (mo5U34)-methyltransferase